MATIYALNPRRRRKVRKARKSASRRPAKRVVRRRRRSARSMVPAVFSAPRRRRARKALVKYIRRAKRNPKVGFVDMLLYGAGGAAGGVAVDFITNLVPLPSSLSTGIGLTGTKVALGLGAGYAVEKLWKREAAGYIASGILAVIFHEAFGSTISGMLSSSTTAAASTSTASTGTAGMGMLTGAPVNPSPVMGTAGLGVLQMVPSA